MSALIETCGLPYSQNDVENESATSDQSYLRKSSAGQCGINSCSVLCFVESVVLFQVD